MEYSVRQLALLMMILLIIVTMGSSVIGFHLLQEYYHTEEGRVEAQARQRLKLAADTVGSQVQFYQGIVDLLAQQNNATDLLSFSEDEEIEQWALQIRSVLPGAFGLALARTDGNVIGDPLVQRIGKVCEDDLAHFALQESFSYPPIHDDVAGLEHFDLLARVAPQASEDSGVLLVSFHISNLREMMERIIAPGDTLTLLTANGREIIRAGQEQQADEQVFTQGVPGTSWQMKLHVFPINPPDYFKNILILNLIMLMVVATILLLSTRHFGKQIGEDMRRIHHRINTILEGDDDLDLHRPTIKEIVSLLPDIDKVAFAVRDQHQQLRDQSLTDPLTQLHNRRYFNLVIERAFEQSRRRSPSVLLMIDVNDFKEINDRHGHDQGDMMLQAIADSLRRNVRSSDDAMRIGGDEFALILHDIEWDQTKKWIENFARRHDRELAVRKPAGLTPNCCTMSIGATLIDASHFASVSAALRAADQAMYKAKAMQPGHSRYHIASGASNGEASTT